MRPIMPTKLQIDRLISEARNPDTTDLDQLDSLTICQRMNEADRVIPVAIEAVLPLIALTTDWATDALRANARIIYIGAGTSGRLGVLDAVECPPTFSTSPNQVVGLIAGGSNAMFLAQEGAEDNALLAVQDLNDLDLQPEDIVIGLAVSGTTPYVHGGLEFANTLGCKTTLICCNELETTPDYIDNLISILVGPEVLTGSTRLKAGSAQKMALNMISTGAMVQIGKTYENRMVDLKPSNAKLRERAIHIVADIAEIDLEQARSLMESHGHKVKESILISRCKISENQATEYLALANGVLKKALQLAVAQ